MYLDKRFIIFLSVLLSILIGSDIVFAGDINGRVGIVMRNGDVKYGAKIDVFLVTRAVSLSPAGRESDYKNKFDYQRALLKSLFHSYQQVEAAIETSDYVKQRVKTDFEGKFSFVNVVPGQYFVVVTFPTKIAGYQVFWQSPVLMEKENIKIDLSNDNMPLTPYRAESD
jgi:hypothetical protein